MADNLSPSEYFQSLKDARGTMTDALLDSVYDNALILLNRYNDIGQTAAISKLIFHMECVAKERELVKLGITQYVYQDDLDVYLDSVEKDAVKIIELERYERDIPDEIAEAIRRTRHICTDYYVVFTDYTGIVERQVEKERRDKDPILFGAIHDESRQHLLSRLYFLGDWEDEYCDLTMTKMLERYKQSTGRIMERTIATPQDLEELKTQLRQLRPEEREEKLSWKQDAPAPAPIKRFFRSVRTFFSVRK